MTTNQSASLAVHGEVKRGSQHKEPKAPLTCGGEAPTARLEFFTAIGQCLEARRHVQCQADGSWGDHTLGDALLWAAWSHGDALAVRHHATSLSFVDLAQRSLDFAAGLIAIGIAPGQNVALWMADSIAWMIARWAVPAIGAVLVPINTRFRASELAFVLEHSDCVGLIMGEGGRNISYLDLLRKIEPQVDVYARNAWRSSRFPQLRHVVGAFDHGVPPSMTAFSEVEDTGRQCLEQVAGSTALQERMQQVQPSDVAQILYTSGTTSFPKGAQVRHAALLQNNFQTVKRMRLTSSDRYLSCVPLFSATGTSYTLSMLQAGAAVILLDRFEPRLFCEAIERERVTMVFVTDTIIADMKNFSGRGDYDLSSLRTGTGAPLAQDAFCFASEQLGIKGLVGVYGMSETSNAVARGDCDDTFVKRSTTNGRPVDGVQVCIMDVESRQPLPPQRMGEICVRGENLMKGYYKNPEEDRKAFDAQGWFHTGDLGELDPDGYLIYRGRVKEMIKPGGFNVATLEIEHFLKTFPGIRQAVVVGVPDARLGEVAYAFLEVEAGVAFDLPALKAYCSEQIAAYKVPRFFQIIDTWPMTASQKIQKLQLRATATAAVQSRIVVSGTHGGQGDAA